MLEGRTGARSGYAAPLSTGLPGDLKPSLLCPGPEGPGLAPAGVRVVDRLSTVTAALPFPAPRPGGLASRNAFRLVAEACSPPRPRSAWRPVRLSRPRGSAPITHASTPLQATEPGPGASRRCPARRPPVRSSEWHQAAASSRDPAVMLRGAREPRSAAGTETTGGGPRQRPLSWRGFASRTRVEAPAPAEFRGGRRAIASLLG